MLKKDNKEQLPDKSKIEILIEILLIVAIVFFIAVIVSYFLTFKELSHNPSDWGSFGALFGGIGMIAFSLTNLKMWLYQSRYKTWAELKQIEKQIHYKEKLSLYHEIKNKLIMVIEPYLTYEDKEQHYTGAIAILQQIRLGFFSTLLKNIDNSLLDSALTALSKLQQISWKQRNAHSTVELNGKHIVDLDDSVFISKIQEQYPAINNLLHHLEEILKI